MNYFEVSMVVLGLLLSWIFGYYSHMAYGENYTYNMSESEMQDEWLTQTCMRLAINSPDCDMVYGGIMDKPSEGKLK
ncbi:hypothetical protein [Serratia sp. (in: enterobacteria)]|uniref:hypothetical protein n=1 Tax=Serratia sp. (in: enterobacteria) TaxID=616 RepID=UPI003989BD80